MDIEFSDVPSFSPVWHIIVNLFDGEQYVSFSLNLFQQDYYTNGHRQPTLDCKDWMPSYSKEENGVTTLKFHRKRNTTDQQNDVTIEVNISMPADL